jgi:MoxR-like ATPase
MSTSNSAGWEIYRGDGQYNQDRELVFPDAPKWRQFGAESQELYEPSKLDEQQKSKGESFQPPPTAVEMVNAALSLRRPLLITGNPGTGKSSLAYSVANELGLGSVLKWAITTRSTLKDGLYNYDAISRIQDVQIYRENRKDTDNIQGTQIEPDNRTDTGNYITLGALGTAFLPTNLPRVLLIDEIDKSDVDLPNDLLNLFEEGEFSIQELQRLEIARTQVRTIDREQGVQKKAFVQDGVVRCKAFPLVIMTSNGERDFSPPFLRRCLRFRMPTPSLEDLRKIVAKHLNQSIAQQEEQLIGFFHDKLKNGQLVATDQLLNVIHMRMLENSTKTKVEDRLLTELNSEEDL